jgi:hypothetical protein
MFYPCSVIQRQAKRTYAIIIEECIDPKKQFTIIVDADDKNCLVQLTVALKPNQDLRQWL